MKKALLVIAGVVALVLAGLLVVPALIDWSSYKDDIAARIERATGRDVAIGGDVGLRLLPAPAFTAERVSVGNSPGAGDEPFATTRELAIRLRLLPLLTGEVAVDSLVLDQPVVNLVRLPDGRGNWEFTAAEETRASPPDGTAGDVGQDAGGGVSIGTLVVRHGLVTYHDSDRTHRIEDIDARIETAGPDGPFRAEGSLAFGGAHATVAGSLDRIGDQRASTARLAVQVLEADARAEFSGLLSRLSGGPTLRGKLTVAAPDLRRLAAVAGGPAAVPLPAETGLDAQAALVADAGQAALSELVATLGGARLTGAVTVGFGDATKVDARLSLASLDLDKWLAAVPAGDATPAAAPPSPGERSRDAEPPAAAAAAFTLPRDLFADLSIGVDALSWRGAVVQDARLEATLDGGELVLNGASAQLPGGSTAHLAGVLAAVDGRPVFDGQAEARSDNLRALLHWLGIDAAAVPRDRLRRLEASADLRADWPRVEARKIDLSLDAVHVTGAVTARLDKRPAYGARLAVDALNLDAYLDGEPAPQRAAAAPPAPAQPAAPAEGPHSAPPLGELAGFDADLALTVNRLTMNQVAAEDVRVQAVLNDGTLTVSQAAAQLAGSRATASGTLAGLDRPEPRAENVVLRLDSPQPARLFRFLGMATPVSLGALTASARLEGDWRSMAVEARAESGGVTLTADGTLASPLDQPQARLAVRAGAQSVTQMVRLFSPGYRPAGPVGAASVSAAVDAGPRAVILSEVVVEAGRARLTGDARVGLDGPRPVVTAQLAGNAIDLAPFLPAERTGFLLPGSPRLPPSLGPSAPQAVPTATAGGGAPWSREPLTLDVLKAFDAKVSLRADAAIWDGWTLASPQAVLVVDQGAAAVDTLTGRLLGGDMTATVRLTAGGVPALTGTLSISGANLSEAKLGAGGIAVTQGRMTADTRFATAGRSTYDMAQNLKGDGRLAVTDGVVQGFDLPAVNRQMQNIENVGSLLGLLNAGLSRGSTRFSKLAGTFTAENGVVTTRDLRLDAEGGTATGEAVVRLPPWTMTAAVAFQLAGAQAPPAVVRLEGPIDTPRKIIDVNALQQHLVARGLGRALGGKDAGRLVEGLLGRRPPPPKQGETQPPQQQPQQQPDGARILQDLLKGLGGR